jgi:hypothetical protein
MPETPPTAGLTPIEQLRLSPRTYNALVRRGIDRAEQVPAAGDIPGVGVKGREELAETLALLGIEFPAPQPPTPPAPPGCPDEEGALPLIAVPLFSSAAPTDEEWLLKRELLDSAIRQYEESVRRRRESCRERLRAEGAAAVTAEVRAVDADERRLRQYRWMRAFVRWMEAMGRPAVRALTPLERCEKYPAPVREDF